MKKYRCMQILTRLIAPVGPMLSHVRLTILSDVLGFLCATFLTAIGGCVPNLSEEKQALTPREGRVS